MNKMKQETVRFQGQEEKYYPAQWAIWITTVSNGQ